MLDMTWSVFCLTIVRICSEGSSDFMVGIVGAYSDFVKHIVLHSIR